MSTGEKLRDLRKRMRKTLKEQSEVFGVSLHSIYRWEHDLVVPRRKVLEKMAKYYGVPLEWLLHEGVEHEAGNGESSYYQAEDDADQQLLRMYRKLPDSNKYKILGYVERVYLENMDRESHLI